MRIVLLRIGGEGIGRAAIEDACQNGQVVRRRVPHAHTERSQRIARSACRHICRGGSGPTECSVDKQRGTIADEELAVDGERADANLQLVFEQRLLKPKFVKPQRLHALDIADRENVAGARRRTDAVKVKGVGVDGATLPAEELLKVDISIGREQAIKKT